MVDWLKNLELEYIIIFGFLALILIIAILIAIKAQRTLNLIGRRALVLTEDLVKRDGIDVVDIMVANTSYVNVEAASIGLVYMKKLLPLKEENTIVLARDSFKLTKVIDDLRRYIIGDSMKVKKIKVYVEDSLGRRSFVKAKNSMRMFKKLIKAELKAARIEAKKNRFETGQYRFSERVVLVIQFIFSPFTKLFRSIRKGLNHKLRLRQERLVLKKKEMEHQAMMRKLAEEEKREEERAELEKRLFEEKKQANIEARMAALKRKEEARKQEEQLIKAEEEKRLAEAEAALHESELKQKEQELAELHKKESEENIDIKTNDSEKEIKVEEPIELKENDLVDEVELDDTEEEKNEEVTKKKEKETK